MPSSNEIPISALPKKWTVEIWSAHPIPSFKNAKRYGKGRVFTEKRVKQRMDEITECFASKLKSLMTDATSTGKLPPSSIAFVAPLDDSKKWIRKQSAEVVDLPRGIAARVTIERIE